MSCVRLIHGMSHGSDASKTSASEQTAEQRLSFCIDELKAFHQKQKIADAKQIADNENEINTMSQALVEIKRRYETLCAAPHEGGGKMRVRTTSASF